MPAATTVTPLLSAEDGAAVSVANPAGDGPFVLACEHASNYVPRVLDSLGLDAQALASHIAWDPGALALAERLSATFDAPLVASRVSRLVYDCNRPPDGAGIVEVSESREVPGNRGLQESEVAARVDEVYQPFHAALAAAIAARAGRARPPVLLTIHSFTPVYLGRRREVEIGVLPDADARFADCLLRLDAAVAGFDVRRNQPYGPGDGVTHTLRRHGLGAGLLNAMIEIRNDLLADPAAVDAVAARLGRWLGEALASATEAVLRAPAMDSR